ncbi:hypothetical protein MM182_06910 [Aeromonas sp. MR19]|uniref:hypothetical protein n=1 Tax=Aeromonas sp. MR19 TaxID=2923421 RepID=UPI001F4B2CAF|nr:hypothetical protein [Aeromonas sp. MR19]MCH7375113.1 hypothetical protein [Aeromonas sp. MR19]
MQVLASGKKIQNQDKKQQDMRLFPAGWPAMGISVKKIPSGTQAGLKAQPDCRFFMRIKPLACAPLSIW